MHFATCLGLQRFTEGQQVLWVFNHHPLATQLGVISPTCDQVVHHESPLQISTMH